MAKKLNVWSSRVTQPKSQGASQAMLYGTGLTEDDMNKPQVGIASVWYEGNPCNMHLLDLAAEVKEGVAGRRPGRHAVQHDRRLRRHLDGHRRHELLAPVARPDRRLDRNRHGRPVVRRLHRAPRLRQEHARLPDGDGPAQPPAIMVYGGTIRAGLHCRRRAELDIVSAFQCYGEFLAGKIDRGRARATSCATPVPAPAPAAACTPPTRWPRRSRRWACRCPTARRSRPRIPTKLDECRARRRGDPQAARARPQAARHHDPRRVRERDGRGDGPRRLDQRRAAPDRDGPRGRRAAHDRRLPDGQRPRAAPRRPQAQRQVRAGRSARRRRHAGGDEVCCSRTGCSTATA